MGLEIREDRRYISRQYELEPEAGWGGVRRALEIF